MRIEHRLTRGQCEDIYERLYDTIMRLFVGGTQYGVDWPTLYMIYPAKARVIRRLQARGRVAK
jgi:hypothetical protein